MKYLTLFAALFLSGCELPGNRYEEIKAGNRILKERVDSLTNEINDLKFGSRNLLKEAIAKNKSRDFIQAKAILVTLIKKYPDSKEFYPAKTLLKTVRPKAEAQLFSNAVKSQDIELFKKYTSEYPKGKYYLKAKNLIKQYQKRDDYHNENTVTTSAKPPRTGVDKPSRNDEHSGVRIGAICCDGTRSYATGRGACSHHGGVCEWLYQ